MKDNKEDIKLIAEFMGLTVFEGVSLFDGSRYYYYNNAEMQDYEALPDYDSDFNELMPVGAKCYKIADDAGSYEWRGCLIDTMLLFDLKMFFKAVVSFIKFYNANPKEFNI